MRPLLLIAAVVLAIAGTPALAQPSAVFGGVPPQATGAVPPQATPHYEFQYGYVGHHPRYEGHWVLVR